MNRRILKKRAKRFMDSFTREKIPAAFTSEEERRQYVSAFARQYVGQAAHFPETAKEAQLSIELLRCRKRLWRF